MTETGPRIRLYVPDDLAAGAAVALAPAQAHYLGTVMRRRAGEAVLLFNGRDGEWRGRIEAIGRGRCAVAVEAPVRLQAAGPDLWLAFAPVKRAGTDLIVEKATELGVAALWPVLTRRAAVERVNPDRLRAIAAEAAEQCGRLTVPEILPPARLETAVADWPGARRVLLCDETGAAPPVAEVLAPLAGGAPGPWAVLTGPEGGFETAELDALRKLPFVTPVGLGPRILRAETAALAAIACWQALLGDWRRTTVSDLA